MNATHDQDIGYQLAGIETELRRIRRALYAGLVVLATGFGLVLAFVYNSAIPLLVLVGIGLLGATVAAGIALGVVSKKLARGWQHRAERARIKRTIDEYGG